MLKHVLLAGVAIIAFAGHANAQWNPRPGWKDSYAVDGRCYCDSNGYDHGVGNLSYDTPDGRKKIPQICADIKARFGVGAKRGRIPYNDVQCGNGPANNAGDEDSNACPGRVDIGSRGCQMKGPRWDLQAVYGQGTTSPPEPSPAPTPTEPTPDQPTSPAPAQPANGVARASASRNSGEARLAIDNNINTRWTTRQFQRPGQAFLLDLGEARTISQVVLDSRQSNDDDPAGYSLAVSTDSRNYKVVATGNGGNGLTTIRFPSQTVRYLRITQTGSKTDRWWSIHELDVGGTSGGTPENNGGNKLNRATG